MTQGTRTAYMRPPESEKLSQLRAKTDRQVLDFVHSKLDLALAFAAAAGVELSQGNRMTAQEALGRADQAFNEAQKLLLILGDYQRRGLDRKLNEARDALGGLCRNREMLRPLFFTA